MPSTDSPLIPPCLFAKIAVAESSVGYKGSQDSKKQGYMLRELTLGEECRSRQFLRAEGTIVGTVQIGRAVLVALGMQRRAVSC